MRAWLLILVLLLLLPLLDAQKGKGKGKGKGGKNQNQNRNQNRNKGETSPQNREHEEDNDEDDDGEQGDWEREDDGEDRDDDERHEEDRDDDDRGDRDDDGKKHKELPLPRNTMLMEDTDVEMGRMHRMFSGDAGCRVSCKGSVSGMTKDDPRYPYYRYINVDITSCYDDNTVFSPDMEKLATDNYGLRHYEFSRWNATVTKLQFYKVKDPNVHQIPKRLSYPTEVQSSHVHCAHEAEGECHPTERSFGFVVFIPRFDMQVKWRVDWEVNARNPYVNMDEANVGHWNYGNCEDVVEEYMKDTRYQSNAFSIDREDGYSFWQPVRDHDHDEHDEHH